jgi:molybdenum cofactor synthesis domain-containing protein
MAASSKERVSVEQYRATALGLVNPVSEEEWVSLADSVGRVASRDVVAEVPLPPFLRSAVDGFAMRAAERGQRLRVTGRVTAGHPLERAVATGEAYEITTGAPVPPGADCVALVEESTREGQWVTVAEAVVPGSHISPEGEDFRRGQALLRQNDVVTGVRVAALASQGHQQVAVWRRPRVAILSTGDELTPLGQSLAAGHVYDVNGSALEAMVRAAGALPIRLGVLRDQLDAVRAGLRAAAARDDWDVLITSGGTGASVPLFQGHDVGTLTDLVPAVVEELGQLFHHGIRMVPGRPTALGLLDQRPVFALPGWPYAVLIHFELMVLPALRKLAHLPPARRWPVKAQLTAPVEASPGFTRVIQARLVGQGPRRAEPLLPPPPPSASRVMTQMLDADGYIMVEDGARLAAGDTVTVWVEPLRLSEELES